MAASLREKQGMYYIVTSYKVGDKYKQKWESTGLSTKNNKRKAMQLLESYNSEVKTIPDCLFVDFAKKWLETSKNMVEKTTWENYDICINSHIVPYFSQYNLEVKDVSAKLIDKYLKDKHVYGRVDGKAGGISISTLKKHKSILKKLFDQAYIDGLVPANPVINVRLPSKAQPVQTKTFLTKTNADVVLKAFEGHQLYPMIVVTLYYGLRRSEVLGLKWDSVDFKRNTIEIKHTVVKNKSIVYKDTTKTAGSARTFPLLKDVREILLKVLEKQNEYKSLYKSNYNDNDYIFCWPDGKLMRPDYITKAFQRVLRNNNLPKMRFHDLRHSTASILFDQGWDIKEVQEWLRHASISMTADVYTHITESRRIKMSKDIEGLFYLSNDNGEKVYGQGNKKR